MTKFHSTVSRRDFMKGLGLAGVGVGAATLTAPMFHDFDELIAFSASDNPSTTSTRKRPWWVKEIDKPTVEIDLNLREPWTGVAASAVIQGKYTDLGAAGVRAKQEQNRIDGAKNNRPGFTLRDQILCTASTDKAHYLNKTAHPTQGLRSIATYEDIGVPKWQGSLEENAFMMRRVIAGFGAGHIGYARIDDDNVGPRLRLFHPGQIKFDSNIEDYEVEGKVTVVPSKCKNVIVIWDSGRGGKSVASPGQFHFYQEKYEWIGKVQNFLWGLGYQSYHMGDAGNTATNVPVWGIFSGMGEYNRTHNPPVPPEGHGFGTGGIILLTDLPLPPTKPIDFGALRFCPTCGVCAEVCPAGAIPTKEEVKEPTWERATGEWSASNDHKGYPNYSPKCAEFFYTGCQAGPPGGRPQGSCGICTTRCVFTHGADVWSHQIVKATASNTTVLNSFFYQMDGYGGFHNLPTDEQRESLWTEYPDQWT